MAETTDVARLLVSIEANLKSYDKAMRDAVKTADNTGAGITKSFRAVNDNLRGQTSNLAAQFQDIGVQLAGGQSPLQIALQQGTQIAAVLGDQPGGAAGAVKSLGAAFLSVISPVSLLTIGTVALGGAFLQWLGSVGEVKGLDDHLKRHADLIKQIKDAYGEAAAGIDVFTAKSQAVLETQLAANMAKLRTEIDATAQSIVNASTTMTPSLGAIEMGLEQVVSPEVTDKYAAFRTAIQQLQEGIAAGEPNIRQFVNAVGEIARQDPSNRLLQELAVQLIDGASKALQAESAYNAAGRAIRVMGDAAAGGTASLREFNNAMERLTKIGLPQLDERARASAEYRKALAESVGLEERRAADDAYKNALQRIGDEDRAKAESLELDRRHRAEEDAARAEQSAARKASRAAETAENKAARQAERIELRAIKDEVKELNKASVELGSSLSEAFKGAILRGEDFDKVLDRLLDRLASGAIDQLFGSIFGASQGGGISPFMQLLGLRKYQSGGYVPKTGPALLHQGEVVLPKAVVDSLGGGNVEVNIINNSRASVSQQQSSGPNGQRIDVVIDEMTASNLSRPGSRSNNALRQFGGSVPLTRR